MTVDECAKRVVDILQGMLCDLEPNKNVVAQITPLLEALIGTESKRAAGVCWQIAEKTGKSSVGGRFARWASEKCHDEILATSPGKGVQGTCPKCDGCGQIATDDDETPWKVWLALPPGSNLAARMGLVQPKTCPECKGGG